MYKNNKILGLIPARGGSKGLPGKNIIPVAGKPLIAWTIEEAKKSRYIDRLVLSSDNTEIIRVAKEWGCEVPFIRPDRLAQDDVSAVEVVIHAIGFVMGYDYAILLQPTSPLRTIDDIEKCIEKCLEKESNCCVSVSKVQKNPYWMYEIEEDGLLSPLISNGMLYTDRQSLPEVFELNGSIYVAKTDWLKNKKTFLTEETLGYIMPEERSIDIDNELDLMIAEALMEKRFSG